MKLSSNAVKWIGALATGFLGGVIIAATHNNSHVWDFCRDGLIGMGPTVAALNITLRRDLGVKEESKSASA